MIHLGPICHTLQLANAWFQGIARHYSQLLAVAIIHNSLFIIRVHHVPQHTRASVPRAALYRSKKIYKMTVISHCESHIVQDLVEGWEPLAI